MSTSTSQDLRCPRCDSHVRAGADWCTLCYQDLRTAPEVTAPAQPPAEPLDEAGEAVEDSGPAKPVRGRHSRPAAGRADPVSDGGPALPDEQIDMMLAQLAAEESGLPLGWLSSRMGSRGAKAGLIIGGSLLATVLVYLVMTLLGALL